MEAGQNCVSGVCCDCWTNGCGCNGAFGAIADGLEAVNPAMEYCADCIWLMGSPLAFPLVFCFPAGPETDPPGGGWQISMLSAPLKRPLKCLLYTACTPCGQWHMRRKALKGDMTKYKLWQGMHDGPQCCARRCPGAPITIESGTYGEQDCPNLFLCAEVTCLAGIWSTCCAFQVTRRLIKDEYNLGTDPTEHRVNSCIRFFSRLAAQLCGCAICLRCSSCLVGCCAPDSEGAQECSGEAGRASRACFQCVRICWRGIWSVKILAMGCMSAQQDYELVYDQPLTVKPAVVSNKMKRGQDEQMERGAVSGEEDDSWWKKPPPAQGPSRN